MLKEITLQYASWEEMPVEYQALFVQLMGNQAQRGRTFYALYFYWFNIAHECAHILREVYGIAAASPWVEERAATEFAVAYWKLFGEQARLNQLGEYLAEALRLLPNPILADIEPAEYFDAHYAEMTERPTDFAYLHFRWALERLAGPLDFTATLRSLITPDAIAGPTITPRFYPEIGPDLPLLIIPDMRELLALFGVSLPPVELVRCFSRALQFVSFG